MLTGEPILETPPRRRALRWLERALLAIGILCLGIYAYGVLDARIYEARENRALELALSRRAAAPPARPGVPPAGETDSFDSFAKDGEARPFPALDLAEGDLLGRIEVERLGVSAIVLEGVGSRTLRRGVGHIPSTTFPHEGGNTGIAGHRDSFFRGLKDIRKDDIITLTTLEGTYRYQVKATQIVRPEDTEVLDPSGEPELTLVTCYPFYYVGSAPKRFIVHASRIEDPETTDSTGP